ncbi:hypothetical protein SteCoe_22039 [Stentor coeruleus]|uniref:Uncharacterized protein n=1 Tax=Stentor coeruleus TaxID=5963 RepID=A0A1R2BN00_9CILI|nr:hypothetical protein SteCoe_22039 [Stentor coeruleus]
MCFQRPRKKYETPSIHLQIQLIDTSRNLPSDFAMRLVEREMSLEKSCEKSIIEDLIKLYSLAIEHYSIKNDEKVKDYQIRMQKMLRRPDVLNAFSVNQEKYDEVKNLNRLEEKEKEKPVESQPDPQEDYEEGLSQPEIIITEEQIECQAEDAVKSKEISDRELGDKLLDCMKSQENDLALRLNRRKSTRPSSMNSILDIPILDTETSRNMSLDVPNENFETHIQEIMERHINEKSEKIAEITVKYNAEINAMEDCGMMAMVIAQMKSNMKQEIDDISKEYDEKRKIEIKKFREDYLTNRGKSMS